MRNTLGRDGRSYSALTPTSSFIGEALNEEPFEYNSFFECRACHKEKLEAHNSGKAGSKNMNILKKTEECIRGAGREKALRRGGAQEEGARADSDIVPQSSFDESSVEI